MDTPTFTTETFVARTAAYALQGLCAALTIADPSKPSSPDVIKNIAADAVSYALALSDELKRRASVTETDGDDA